MPEAKTRFRVVATLPVLWWVTIFVATHIPAQNLPTTPVGDKTEHYLAYGILAFLTCLVFRLRGTSALRSAVMTLAACAAYGAFDELTQPFFNRVADVWDWVADVVGAATGTLICTALLWAISKSK